MKVIHIAKKKVQSEFAERMMEKTKERQLAKFLKLLNKQKSKS